MPDTLRDRLFALSCEAERAERHRLKDALRRLLVTMDDLDPEADRSPQPTKTVSDSLVVNREV